MILTISFYFIEPMRCPPSVRMISMVSLEQMCERWWYGGFKLHGTVRNGVIKTQHVSMQTKASDGIVAIAICMVTTHGMPHICRMYTYLILASCL